LAEFENPDRLLAAAGHMRSAGYQRLDAFSPFPIHGMDRVLGVRPTRLPWLVLAAGLLGGMGALAFQWWTNAVDYPYRISGKPMFSLPANIPVTFEVTILAAACAAFVGMLVLNGLPRLANPIFRSERFRSATTDRFFLLLESGDPAFDATQAVNELQRVGVRSVEMLTADIESQSLPRVIPMTLAVLGALALIPPVMIASSRGTTSEKPRLHNFFDMDFQPKFKSQTPATLFADGRAMRPRVAGTVAWGTPLQDQALLRGIAKATQAPEAAEQATAAAATPSGSDAEAGPTSGEPSIGAPNWVTEIPMPVTPELINRGRERFNIHCAVCHGRAGYGNGLASQRALELEQGTWVPPTSLHADHVREQPVGQLFHSITHGVRKMPAYGPQTSVEDRWAIVLYLRALQRSQNASVEDVPEELRPTLREMN
jgi:mono/diheme cytochrome c family protein